MANKPTKPNFPLGLESQDQSVFQEGILNNGVVEHGPDAVMTVPETPDASGVPSAVRYNEDDDQFEGFYNEGGWLPLGGGNGGRWEALPHASSSLLQAGRAYLVDNTDGVSTVLFPSPKRVGDSVTVCDLYGKFSTYPLTVDGNGKSIYGSADSMTISTDNVSATFTWTGEARGWVITSGVGLGQGRVYSREIYSQILSATTPSITLSTQPSIVDVYVDGKRLKESLYTLDGYEVKFDPALASGSDVQIIQYIPIQLGAGGGGSGGTVITWEYNGGSAIGGETQIVLDVVVDSVSEIYIRGSRQQIGRGFTFDPATSTITLADELEAGDDVVVVINGDPTVYNQIDRTPWEVARANNVPNSEVILSTDKASVLDGKTVLYDVLTQKYWGIPFGLPAGVKIISVTGEGVLVYTPNVNVQLNELSLSVLQETLSSEVGFSILGSVSPRSGLRNVKTNYNGQSVLMKQAVTGGPVLNAIATHRPGMTAADDDYSTFVTTDGQVYQFDTSAGVDFRLAGALLDGSNAGACIKKIVDTEVAKAIAADSIDACKKVVLINPLGNNDLTRLTLDTDETLVVPSFMSLWHVGQVRYKFNGLTKPAFRICNEIAGLTSSMADFVDIQGADVIKGNGYLIDIAGPNPMTYTEWAAVPVESRSAAAGVEFGNTYSSGSLLDCRDTNIENVLIRGFKGGLQWHGFDTYINTFKNINLVSNEYSFYAPTADKSNSGEKIVFDGGVAGNCFRSHFYWNQVGMSMTFKSWSFDYATENVIELQSSGRGNDFIFENCWFEGWGGFLIRQYPITTTWSYRKNKIGFYNSKIVGAKKSQSEWAPRRKIIFAPTDNNIIEFINTPIEWPSPPSEPQIALMGYTDDTIKYNRSKFECPNNPYEDELLNYAYGLNGDGYKFSGTEGVSVKDSKDATTNISVDTNNNSTAFKVEYGPVDEDGLRCLKITTTATTDLVVLSNKQLKVKAPKHTVVNAGISIKMAAVTAGAVKFGMQLRAYNNPVSIANSSTFVVSKTYTLNGSLASDPYDVTSLLSAAGTPLTTDKYVGVQTSRVMAFDNTVAMHFVPTITLTGFVGTIYVKLPVWWVSSGSAPAAYSIEES